MILLYFHGKSSPAIALLFIYNYFDKWDCRQISRIRYSDYDSKNILLEIKMNDKVSLFFGSYFKIGIKKSFFLLGSESKFTTSYEKTNDSETTIKFIIGKNSTFAYLIKEKERNKIEIGIEQYYTTDFILKGPFQSVPMSFLSQKKVNLIFSGSGKIFKDSSYFEGFIVEIKRKGKNLKELMNELYLEEENKNHILKLNIKIKERRIYEEEEELCDFFLYYLTVIKKETVFICSNLITNSLKRYEKKCKFNWKNVHYEIFE